MKATARPDSSIMKDSPWSLAEMMFMPIFLSAFMALSRRSEVVPAVVTTFLPLRSSKSLMLAVFFDSRRVPTSKMPTEKSTCFWRSSLLVVDPHSMSTVPFCTSGMRVCEVTRL
ncbi:hypothetical protein PAERUG_P54_1_London_24_VIM_2_04_13_00020 [Pseudomonas aeruginosa]|nr:hypothetical protein PAERUG_P48_London_17_VIM_2_01_13_00931 [Pseudomonas aeruginosa]CRW86649.1 hypothetical protein PAERUG_P54_1_London_24_VIM_2_04_13_00020 [Pseudomonas aeruginosa]